MKKTIALLLAAFSTLTVFAVEPGLRIDGRAEKDKIRLTVAAGDKMRGTNMNWIKDQARKVCTVTSYSIRPVTKEWQEFSLTVSADKKGRIELNIMGPYAGKAADRPWIDVTDVRIDGKPVSDMTKTYESPAGHPIPRPFWMPAKALYLPKAGPNGTPAVRVNHDNPLCFGTNVDGAKLVKISVKVKLPAESDLK